jgi:hypothetical protein
MTDTSKVKTPAFACEMVCENIQSIVPSSMGYSDKSQEKHSTSRRMSRAQVERKKLRGLSNARAYNRMALCVKNS